MIGEEDHIRIQVLSEGLALGSCYDIGVKIDDVLDEKLDYSFSEKLGYLTQCPTNLGTGLRASLMVHLPGIEKAGLIKQLITAASKLGLAVRGSYGEGTNSVGSVYQISNQVTLGITEEGAIKNLESIVNEVISQERQTREAVANRDKNFDDTIYRIYGTMKYARSVSSVEATAMISRLKLGISLGILDNITLDDLNTLASLTGRYTISTPENEDSDSGRRDRKRADIIRETLSKT